MGVSGTLSFLGSLGANYSNCNEFVWTQGVLWEPWALPSLSLSACRSSISVSR